MKLEFMIAQLTSVICNIKGGKTKAKDFMPDLTQNLTQNTSISVEDKIRAIF